MALLSFRQVGDCSLVLNAANVCSALRQKSSGNPRRSKKHDHQTFFMNKVPESISSPVAVSGIVYLVPYYAGSVSPLVSLPKGSSNRPVMKASAVNATGVPIV